MSGAPVQISIEGRSIILTIIPENGEGSFSIIDEEDAFSNGEARCQLMECCNYEYEISQGYQLKEIPGVVNHSKRKGPPGGRITTGNYTGTLLLDIIDKDGIFCITYPLEVRSIKTSYREDYRAMLEDIAEKCTDLLMLHSSPVVQNYIYNPPEDPKTLYQQFAFVKSIVDSIEFNEAVHKILADPVTRWLQNEEIIDVRRLHRIDSSVLRQMASGSNRIDLPENHCLKPLLGTVPGKIGITLKEDTTDNIENQFVKYVLSVFSNFSSEVRSRFNVQSREYIEALNLEETLNNYLDHPLFKGMSQPFSLPLNNPVLQRKEGYREVLKVWLLFDLAAKLIWQGGEDVYGAGKRDVSKLYEYWLFFKLLETLEKIFVISPKTLDKLIVPTDDGLGLMLRSGKFIALEGTFDNGSRRLHISFCYNRQFAGRQKYPNGGSWTEDMRPDYTLSIWPEDFSEKQAEEQEVIIHLHFDAKYKIEDLRVKTGINDQPPFNEVYSDSLEEQVSEDKKLELSDYQSDNIALQPLVEESPVPAERSPLKINQTIWYNTYDLYKMHAYKDAIRRTAGAYILYPGEDREQPYKQKGFHEIIPGLGAFNIRPSKKGDSNNKRNDDIEELSVFIKEVVNHFINRSTQQERLSYHVFEIHKKPPVQYIKSNEFLPEKNRGQRVKPPDETFVMIASCSKVHYDWIKKNKIFDISIDTSREPFILLSEFVNSNYVLIHQENILTQCSLWQVNGSGPLLLSKFDIMKLGYYEVRENSSLVFNINPVPDFFDTVWDISKLEGYHPAQTRYPKVVTLTEIMKVIIRQ